ncbi:response regulator transcription factor [Novosphingobium aquiterrae]|uniref:Response regulator transcription factor n=1 Tax=Novosphingobium aquiterrae TaxID=624388 RepID=A0ABV6PIP4_9SPHN
MKLAAPAVCLRVTGRQITKVPVLRKPDDIIRTLTDKQREALELVLQHNSSKEIARLLNVSPKTVDQRLDGARAKLGVTSRSEAARLYASLTGTWETLPYRSSPVTHPPDLSDNSSSELPSPIYTMHDAQTFDVHAPWQDGEKRFAPKLRGLPDSALYRVGIILAGAAALLCLTLLGLGVANGLGALLDTFGSRLR